MQQLFFALCALIFAVAGLLIAVGFLVDSIVDWWHGIRDKEL